MFELPEIKTSEILMYLRKSRTDDPALTVSETVAKHEKMLDDYSMNVFGELIPEQNRFREIVSGETIDARPEIQKVLRLIEKPQFKALIIVEPQRLSRGDLEDIGRISKILRYTKTYVITRQYTYDLTDERDRSYFEQELKRGNEYLEYSTKIMMNGRILSVEQGHYIFSREPYGYKRVFKREGKRRYPTLEIVPEEADIIRIIFNMYAAGNGATKICNYLNAIGSKPKRGNMWTPPCIYSMIDNPIYNGKVKGGYRKSVKSVENGEITIHNPRNNDYSVYEGKHDAIISDDLWRSVRYRRDRNEIPRVKASSELKNPLSGLLYCSCGRMMIRRPFSGRALDRMQCPNQTHCGNASCTVDEMLDVVISALTNAVSDFNVRVNEENGVDEKYDHIRILKNRLSEIEQKEESLWEKYVEGMPPEIFDKLISKINMQKKEISAMIKKEEAEPSPVNYHERIVTFSETIKAIKDPEVSVSESNKLLKLCIKRITYSRERGARSHGQKTGWDTKPMKIEIQLII